MGDNDFSPLGLLDSVEVGVQPTLDGQDILIRHSDIGQRFACLLAFGQADIIRREGVSYWRVTHNRQVDGLMVELIDLLISIRYAHPTLVQLELEMEPAEP